MAPPVETVDGRLVSTGTVGHFGCQAGDRLVRVGVAENVEKGATRIEVDPCPACGNPHRNVKPDWRQPTEADEGREVEVVVDAEGQVVG